MTRWRYEIQHGPTGETDYAWVYGPNGDMVCTAKLHHAFAMVDGMNNIDFLHRQILTASELIDEIKKNELALQNRVWELEGTGSCDAAEIDQMIGTLRDRTDDKLCLDAADELERLSTGGAGS